jgi:hypothetical protein
MKNKKLLLFLSLFFGGLLFWTTNVQATVPTNWLGRIFLQVESRGEAWYVNPLDAHRYFLGRPSDAFAIMRALGLGVSNKDFSAWQGKAPLRLSGRIVLKVEDLGKAYYVNPKNLELLFLGSPTDAFAVMRQVGIGITNANLNLIPVEFNLPIVKNNTTASTINGQATSSRYLSWTYKKKIYSLDLSLDSKLNQSYAASPKDFIYRGALPDDWRERYYKTFLIPKTNDNSISLLINKFRLLAKNNNLSDDELVELVVSFVQAIPYDNTRTGSLLKPNYPYETLYRKLGVCSDKVFLGVMLLRELGYGAAIMDYPDRDHSALGIQCPSQYAVHNSPYCFAETTNFFPLGFVPQDFGAKGAAVALDEKTITGQFDKVFETNILGRVEIYQQTKGKVYQGIAVTHQLVNRLKLLEINIANNKQIINTLQKQVEDKLAQIDLYKQRLQDLQAQNKIESYNNLILEYNQVIQEYNQLAGNYKIKTEIYNSQGVSYNEGIGELYVAGPAL